MKETSRKRILKAAKISIEVTWWILLISLAVIMFSIIGAKLKGRVPNLFGYSVMHITTSSMGNEIPKDAYILVKKVSAESIENNDIICFYSTDPDIYGMPNTHRVIKPPIINPDGSIEFVTKGDMSPDKDPVNARGDKLIGIYVKRLHTVERISSGLNARAMILIIVVIQAGTIAMSVYNIIREKNKKSVSDTETDTDDREK